MSIHNKQFKYCNLWIAGTIYFIVIPLILSIVFLMSDSLKESLLLYPNNPTFISIIGSNYLHTDFLHFISNLGFYLILMFFIFTFDALTNRKMLYVNLLLLFVALPIFSSLVNVAALSEIGVAAPGKGFSAIVAGVFGYLAFSMLHYIRDYHKIKFDKGILQSMWTILYINLALISLVYGYYLMIVILAFLLIISGYHTRKDFNKIFTLINKAKRIHRTLIVLSLLLCLSAGVQGLFPETVRYGDILINILAHYVGYMFGFIVPAAVSLYIIEKRK